MATGQTPSRRNRDRPGESPSGTPDDGVTVFESNTQGSGSEPSISPAPGEPEPTPARAEPAVPARPTAPPVTVRDYVRAPAKDVLGIVRAHRDEEVEAAAAASDGDPARTATEPLFSNEGMFREQQALRLPWRARILDSTTRAVATLRDAGTAFRSNAGTRLSSLGARLGSAPPPDRPRTVRPVLQLLVLGAFLAIVGTTASGQAALVTGDSTTTILNATVSADAAAVRSFVGLNLSQTDLQPGGLSAARQAALQHGLHLLTDRGGILHAALLAPDGTVLASDDGASVGQRAPLTAGLTSAVKNSQADAAIVPHDNAGALAPLATDSVLREYLPIIDAGRVYATVALWRDAAPILAQLEEGRIRVVVITLTAALVSALLLFFVFRTAQQRLTRQTLQLLEAARRDPLTNALNHGTLVEALAAQVEAARPGGGGIGVALLDLDNFGLLDDTYGHPAGDHVLIEVVRLLAEWVPPGATWGRYGPDEFLVITATGDAAALEPAVERLRTTLADETLQFEGSERLPVTFSAGLCFYPTNGESVTTLLSMTAMTLEEAKASGGNAIRVAEARPPAPGFAQTFNILEGLVIAIDTKDRYTRRHSDDVARYADFLALRLELDPDTRRAIHNAGLLHDIGKIGIPDSILHKPGRLTDEEFAIFKQHVALGDAIVRDLPDIDLIRAGIRHHHERWDGRGYLDGLAGEEIPLVARILAVGDAFSAMTTTRTYRKSLTVEEALKRLEEAAGGQLDPRLVGIFVGGIQSAADAPLPAEPTPVTAVQALLVPGRQVA
jgi:diguanylate cyclase (GGDEF)-like protein